MTSSDRPPRKPASVENRPIIILVLGILGITTCAVLAPMAWIWGVRYERDCRRRGEKADSTAVVGRILGMVGTGIFVLAAAAIVIWLVVAAPPD